MRVHRLASLCLVCLFALSLSSCGGGGTVATTTTPTNAALTGAVIDGKVSGATLTLYSDIALTNQVGSGTTDSTGAFNITLTVATAPDPVYIKSVGGTDIDTGMPAPTMIFVGNTGGTNALTSFNVTPLTYNVFQRIQDGRSSTLAAAQTAAQTAFGLSSNTGTDGLYEDPTLAANAGLKTAEFKQLSAGTLGGTIAAGSYNMYVITIGGSDVGNTAISSISALTNPAGNTFVSVSLSVDASGNITGSDGNGNYFTGKVVGSSMMFNIVNSLTSPTNITRVVGDVGLNGSVAGNWSSVSGLGQGSQTMEKGVFVGSLIPSTGVNATNLNSFIQSFYTPSSTVGGTGAMNIVARDIFTGPRDATAGSSSAAALDPHVVWGTATVTGVSATGGTATMSPMVMHMDAGSVANTTAYTFPFVAGAYVKSGTIPTNLLVFEYNLPSALGAGSDTLYIATAVGLRRGIYAVVSSTTGKIYKVGESYLSKTNSVAPNPFVAGKSYDIAVASINAGMPGNSRQNALTNGVAPRAGGPLAIPSNAPSMTNGYLDANNTSNAVSQLLVFEGSMLAMKTDPDNFGSNSDYMRLVQFYDSGAMQGEEIDGGTITLGTTTASLQDYPSTFVGFVQDSTSSVVPSFTGALHFLARTIYSTGYASFQHAYVSGTVDITTPPSGSTAGSATLSYTSGDGTSGSVTLTVAPPATGQPGLYHMYGPLANSQGYIDLDWPIGGTKAVYMISASSAGNVNEVGEAYLTQ